MVSSSSRSLMVRPELEYCVLCHPEGQDREVCEKAHSLWQLQAPNGHAAFLALECLPRTQRFCIHCNQAFGPGSIYTGCTVCGGLVHVNCVRPHYERRHPDRPIPEGYRRSDGGMEAIDSLADTSSVVWCDGGCIFLNGSWMGMVGSSMVRQPVIAGAILQLCPDRGMEAFDEAMDATPRYGGVRPGDLSVNQKLVLLCRRALVKPLFCICDCISQTLVPFGKQADHIIITLGRAVSGSRVFL